jgi:hypothetical protein
MDYKTHGGAKCPILSDLVTEFYYDPFSDSKIVPLTSKNWAQCSLSHSQMGY